MVSAMVPSFVSAVLGDVQDDLVCLLDVDEFVEVHWLHLVLSDVH